jgi:hypothetical protein
MNEDAFMFKVAFLCDIFGYMNELNVKLQGRKHNVADLADNISAFRRKLELFDVDISSKKLLHFPTLKTAIADKLMNADLAIMSQFIQQLSRNFEERFDNNFKIDKQILLLLRDPFAIDVAGGISHEVTTCFSFVDESIFQLHLVDLQSDEALKVKHATLDVEDFWIVHAIKYPIVRDVALTLLTMFGSTYVCESTFSIMNYVKNKQRMSLCDKRLEHCLRIATTSCVPNFKQLAGDRTCHLSH